MTAFAPRPVEPVALSGAPDLRGQGQARLLVASTEDVARMRAATVGRVESARAEGVIDADAEAYLAAQRAFTEANDPESLAEVRGIARGFGLSEEALFTHLHLGTLRDLKSGARLESDGCSAWAVRQGAEGPMVVKNRDISGPLTGVPRVAQHSGPDISTGTVICVGSLGSPGAYSSGMNAHGLALVDTQVAVATHRVGWLRYFLMTRLLARCATVAQALEMLRSVPHAGGGTLVLADRSGDIAAVEISAAGVSVTTGAVVWRTNHFVTPSHEAETLFPDGDRIAGNSRARFRYFESQLPNRDWSVAAAAELMASHVIGGSAPSGAPVCQHPESDSSKTLSSAIYSCSLGTLTFSDGNPCDGNWLAYRVPS